MNDMVQIPEGYAPVDSLPDKNKRPEKSRKREYQRLGCNALMAMDLPPIKWIVPGYVPEGFIVLAGRQKLGKSWLALDWVIAIAVGGIAMGSIQVEAGNVLYLDLENGRRRDQDRIRTLFHGAENVPDLSLLEWQFEAPPLGAGLIELLEKWRQEVENPRAVVIDVLQRVKPAGIPGRNSYENDYAAYSDLQKWATDNGIAVVGLHHTRKGGADDPLEALSGSNGLSACADTTLLLDRDGQGASLYVRGRDVQANEVALEFLDGQWSVTGDVTDVRRSGERTKLLSVLYDSTDAMSPAELASVTGMKPGNTRKLLFHMVKASEVVKRGTGAYFHPENPKLKEKPSTSMGNTKAPGNSGNTVTLSEALPADDGGVDA